MKRFSLISSTVFIFALLVLSGGPIQAQTIRVTHPLGTTEVNSNPDQIVVFDWGILDAMDTLGIEVAAVPKASSLPPYLAKYEAPQYRNVGNLKEPDFEAINALKPDLIIISGRQADYYDEFSRIAPTLYMGIEMDDYLGSFEANMETLGKLFGKEDEVAAKLAETRVAIDRVRGLASNKTVLLTLVTGGKVSTFGPGSRYGFVFDVLELSPVNTNIVSSTHGQSISFEYILVNDPDYLLVIDRDAVVESVGAQTAKQVIENALVKHTKAYNNGNIVYLDPNYWYLSGGGFTSFNKMIDDIETAISP